ncbi:MAG: hypothetical protein L7T26_05250, partial [Pseudomonadales bacterium]|nr:hypothetical protein [Pseudomonadales bacterium]
IKTAIITNSGHPTATKGIARIISGEGGNKDKMLIPHNPQIIKITATAKVNARGFSVRQARRRIKRLQA